MSSYRQTLGQRLFIICFILLLIIDSIDNTSLIYSGAAWLQGMYLVRNLLYLLLLVKAAFLSGYRRKELAVLGVLLILSAVSFLTSGDSGLLVFCAVALAAKGTSPRRLAVAYGAVKGASVVLTPLLWRIGLLPAIYYEDSVVGFYNTFGFCHRNVFGATVTMLCLLWFYLRFQKLSIVDAALWTGGALWLYRLVRSRTSLILMLLIILLMFAVRRYQHPILEWPYLKRALTWGFFGILALCLIAAVFYSPDWTIWKLLDRFLTRRISFANRCFQEYGLSLFGREIPFVASMEAQNTGVQKLILDNSYLRAILIYGIIPGLTFMFFYWKALLRSARAKDAALLVCLTVYVINGVSERYMLDVFYQFPLLIAFVQYFLQERPPVPGSLTDPPPPSEHKLQ